MDTTEIIDGSGNLEAMEATEVPEIVVGPWDYCARGADIVGYASFFLTLMTLFTTVRIRKSLLAHVERSDFLKDIDDKIKAFRSYEETIQKDAQFYNDALLEKIQVELDDVLIAYGTILKKEILGDIKNLQSHIEKSRIQNYPNNSKTRSACRRLLHSICARLEKEKKLI